MYFCDATVGGIMEYAVWQASALAKAGVRVVFLCRPEFPHERLSGIEVRSVLGLAQRLRSGGRLARSWRYLSDIRHNARCWARVLAEHPDSCGLDACYREYFAPYWVGPLRRLAKQGRVLATIAHDPIRDHVVGPRWWHHRCVAAGYSFVRDVFVHDETPIDVGTSRRKLRVTVIPHGPYPLPRPGKERAEIRAGLGLPAGARVFLAFGHIRDNKNLDLFIKTMTGLPDDVYLLVAGSDGAQSQRSAAHYMELAERLGVGSRCRWLVRHVSQVEAAECFAASDYVLLTYSASFHSASGVLNTAVAAERPVLASSGAGPLRTLVQQYRLGEWVEPDSAAEVLRGARDLLARSDVADWAGYRAASSWERNAELVIGALWAEGDRIES